MIDEKAKTRVSAKSRIKLARASSRPGSAGMGHEPTDLVAKRARVMYFDARRAEVWQATFTREAPTMEFAYGMLIRLGLDAFEKQRGAELLIGEPRPEV